MPDYIYLLENRLSGDQQSALRLVSQAAREAGMNVFLAGGAVRDLISGSSVRDLDVAVQGNALKLKKTLLKVGASLWGEHEESHTLFLHFPVGVRVEVSSTRREEYPKPGKPVYHFDSILEDLRRRDFTANAMALSLNERSYGLLMDPLNGVADIESRQLRLVSSYGFIEDPARLLRATRLSARLGWELEERTRGRFQTAKEEGAIQNLSLFKKGYELEEIGHEEDGLQVLAAMEREGWMEHLFPAWTSAKADVPGLEEMHRLLTQLQMQGVNPDSSSASMELLTAKLSPKEVEALKKTFVRPGFVEEWNSLEREAKDFQRQLTAKAVVTPSSNWKLFASANPQAVLWLGLTSKSAPIQAKYKNFLTVWPEARLKIPYALMQEMRITPEIPGYEEMIGRLFFETMDGKLETEDQLRAFLQPYSPPAPPPPVTVRRTRASRKAAEAKLKSTLDEDADDVEDADEISRDSSDEEELEELPVRRPKPVLKDDLPAKGRIAQPKRGDTPPPSPSQAPAISANAVAPASASQVRSAKKVKPAKSPAPAKPAPGRPSAKKPLPVKASPAKPAKKSAAKPLPATVKKGAKKPGGKSVRPARSQKTAGAPKKRKR